MSTSLKIAFIASVIVFLLLIGIVFLLKSQKPQSSSSNQPTPIPSMYPGDQGSVPGKLAIGCSEFETKEYPGELETNSRGDLPSNFPNTPERSTLCGFVPSRKTVFYTTGIEDKNLLDYYKVNLENRQCSTSGILPAPPDRLYALSLPYTCDEGTGIVATFATISAYVVAFYPYR